MAVLALMLGVLFTWHGRGVPDRWTGAPERAAERRATNARLVVPFDVEHAGEIMAAKAMLFERAGVAVDVLPADTGYDPISAVVNGQATFGVAEGAAFLTAKARGAPIVAFGGGYLESPIVFFAREAAGIHTPQEFVGRKVGRPGGRDALIYDALLRNVGLARSQIAEVSSAAGVEALADGAVDVLSGRVGPQSYELRSRGIDVDVIRPANYGIHVPGTIYFTTAKFAEDHPSAVQRFLNAVIGGWRLSYADYNSSVPQIAAAINYTAERVRFELGVQRDWVLPPGRRIGEFDDLQWRQLRQILMAARLIEEGADVSRAVDYSFLKEAYRRPVAVGE